MPGENDKISYFREDVLAGRVALVSGGGSGIGFEIARQFGLHGAKGVVLVGRRAAFLEDAVKILAAQGIKAEAVAGDVRRAEDCIAAVKRAVDVFGSLDILINAAAGNFLATADKMSTNAFKTVMEIDTQGTFNLTHAAFEPLKASKFGGVVTSITSTLHYTATWWQTAPVAAKAAIDALMRNLALEWGEFGIRCNTVAPGPILDTPGLEKLSGGRANEMTWDSVPIRRAGTKAEVGSACIFLCLNGNISGLNLALDGGLWFGSPPSMPRALVEKVSRGIEKGSRAMGPDTKAPSKL